MWSSLAGYGLRGSLPTELGDLRGGLSVDLMLYSNPNLGGSLPTQIGNLGVTTFDIDLHYTAVRTLLYYELNPFCPRARRPNCI